MITTERVIAIFMICWVSSASAITLESVLQTTLEKNPAIQEAKAGLEQATGRRLVFRSVVWPRAEVGVPAGVQAGHRAGESGVKGFAVGRGSLDQVLFNMAVPPSLRRGDVEVLIAQQHSSEDDIAFIESLFPAFRDRRYKKREFRALWITRVTAACRARGIRYSP